MTKRFLASLIVAAGFAFSMISPASAQVHTGGSNFTRAGVPSEGEVLRRRGASGEFGRNNTMVPGSESAPRHGHGQYGHRHPNPHQRYAHGGGYRGGVIVAPAGAYQERLITRFGGSTVARGGARPVPTPEQVAKMVKHKQTFTAVPCIDGYVKNPDNNQCDLVAWVPGPDPQ